MKKKNWFTFAAVAIALTTTLAGCGSGNSPSNESTPPSSASPSASDTAAASPSEGASPAGKTFENPELDVAVFQGGYGREFWDSAAEAFMQDYPGTKINITASPKIGELIRPKIVAGNPPDFMYISGSDNTPLVNGLIKDKALLDLTEVFEELTPEGAPLKDKILDGVLNSRATSPYDDGKVYLAPYNFGVMGLWYNKALFEAKGITPPKTWDDFFAANAAAKENGRALLTYQGIYPGYLEEMIVPAIYAAGGQEALKQFFDYDPEFWKSDTFKQVWGLMEKIATEDNALMTGTVALNHTQSQTAFLQGKAMFIPNGSWFEDEMKDAPREDGFSFGYLGVPSFGADKPVSALTNVETVVIPAKAKNPELAKEFLKYLYTDKIVQLNGDKAKAVMAVKGAPDLVKAYITETTYNVYKAADDGMIAVNGAFKPVAKGSKFNPSDEVYKPFSSIMSKQMTLDQYAEKLYKVYSEIQKELEAAGAQ
ncbi:N-acetylglucosamine transport system substrate-binding protein [Paenibacillus algorifonticola]|uniref:N-acetylglucosamine transport system substrate-binding protein n=1 Tax=Paenibacillus algorifonticola TaxID=684063 RepID=A0A1I2FJ89_9BACL|nr:carbohydrate ABC transporter substrate-binding protein [Paenibacillus algorifonticola]SFF05063.1 N-acetylglucosamine transport system substrate-binding protein [Paenibacillus algorifonticola]